MAHIVLLEPNTLLAQTYTKALTNAGHFVTIVANAQRAIHEADKQPPQVVILELQLPGHNGIEFLHEFRSYPDWQQIPVIINTALPPARMQALAAALQSDFGIETILYKPATTLIELCQAVRRYTPGAQ